VEEVGNGKVKIVPQEEWEEIPFLNDKCNISSQKAEILLGFRSKLKDLDYKILLISWQ